MLATSRPTSTFSQTTNFSSARPLTNNRPSTKDGEKEAIWIPMLNNVSKGKELAEKQLVVLGGTPDQQKEFLEQLNPENLRQRRNDRRKPRQVPVSNRYALGYTYHDILDADQDDLLARLNVHLLAHASASFAPLLKALFTAKTVKETLIVILLDWSDPITWARQLRQWIRLLRTVILSLDDETKIELEENMTAWKEKRVGPDVTSSLSTVTNTEQKPTQALLTGPGEWDEGLGIPLCVVCVQAEKMDLLERDHGWQEDHFDFLMQWMRTVLLKHGSSLIYTSTYDSNYLRTLVHSSLNIQSVLKRDTVKHNFVDRDKILVPSNWDSWGKIRVLKEDFDFETVGGAWSIEIQRAPEQSPNWRSKLPPDENDITQSAVALFESSLPTAAVSDLSHTSLPGYQPLPMITPKPETVTCPPVQEFLQAQYLILEKLKEEEESRARKARKGAPAPTGPTASGVTGELDEGNHRGIANARMAEHIGPFSTNVNGIDLNPEEAIKRLKEREAERNASKESSTTTTTTRPGLTGLNTSYTTSGTNPTSNLSAPTPTRARSYIDANDKSTTKSSNEALKGFFDSLINKDRGRGLVSGNASAGGAGSGNASNAQSPLRSGVTGGRASPLQTGERRRSSQAD